MMNSEQQKLEKVLQYFLENHCDDPINGTKFDCAVIDSIRELKNRFADKLVTSEVIKLFEDRLNQCDSLGKYNLFTKDDIKFLLNHIRHLQQKITKKE